MYFNSVGTGPPNQLALVLIKSVTQPCGEFFLSESSHLKSYKHGSSKYST